MTMITPSYLGETIEYSSLHACRSTLEDPTLLKECFFVMTDSGGVQEEAPTLGKPVLVLRNTTERPEGIEANAAILVGTEAGPIYQHAARLLDDEVAYLAMARAQNPYGDGKAAQRIADVITQGTYANSR